jgi:ribosomal protein S18 acetylase RimI-like enzyme
MASAAGGELARWLVRRAAPCDAEAACAFGRARFIDTFGHLYSEGDLATYLAESYTVDVFTAWLADPLMRMWLAHDATGALLGYALAGPPTVPHADVAPGDGELRKLYLCEAAKGSGVARALLGPAVAWVRAGGCAPAGTPLPAGGARAWLNVWSENSRAIRFYEREGFAVVGEFEYCVGEARDRELIMRLGEGAPAPALAPPAPTPAGTSGGSGSGSRHVLSPALQLARAALALLLLVATVAAAPCTSDEGCSLNGVCGAGGVCACDAGWRGDSCGELAVVAGSAALGYHNASAGVGASWGANAVFADGAWHAFVAEMTHNCTLNDYGSNSRIIRATSTAGPRAPTRSPPSSWRPTRTTPPFASCLTGRLRCL